MAPPFLGGRPRRFGASGAAMDFHCLVDEGSDPPVQPVFGERDREPAEDPLTLIAARRIESARDAEYHRGRRLAFKREIGKHVARRRLVDEAPLEGRSVADMVRRMGEAEAHDALGHERDVEAGVEHSITTGMPRPSSPTSQPCVLSNSSSV
nr:hypothetical protein [Sphingopyxis sp.]